jgi:hypothetical protein
LVYFLRRWRFDVRFGCCRWPRRMTLAQAAIKNDERQGL